MREQCKGCLYNVFMLAPDYHTDENGNILAGERIACHAYEEGIPEEIVDDTQKCDKKIVN